MKTSSIFSDASDFQACGRVTEGKPPYSFSIGDGTSLPPGFNMGSDGNIGGGGTLAPGSLKSISKPQTNFTIRSAMPSRS